MLEFNLSQPDNELFVQLTMIGQVNRERAVEVATQVNNALDQSDRLALLVDLRDCENTDKPANNFHYAKDDTKEIGLVAHERIAFVVKPSDYSHDFTAIAMRNSGYNVHIFRDYDQAVVWLNQAGS